MGLLTKSKEKETLKMDRNPTSPQSSRLVVSTPHPMWSPEYSYYFECSVVLGERWWEAGCVLPSLEEEMGLEWGQVQRGHQVGEQDKDKARIATQNCQLRDQHFSSAWIKTTKSPSLIHHHVRGTKSALWRASPGA